MVEFAMVSVLLVLVVLGIINFGLILSFKQDVTRAAAEGARAGAVALPPPTSPSGQTTDPRYVASKKATEEAVDSFGKKCTGTGMTCTVIIHNCKDVATPNNGVAYYNDTFQDCVTVRLNYDYAGFPLLPKPPLLAGLLPDRIAASSVARLNE